jgi:two-component system, cell cycle sensor histidine kinase and response regulator CckA
LDSQWVAFPEPHAVGNDVEKSDRVNAPTAAQALWTATERLRALEEATPAAIVALDHDGRVTIWNRGAEHLFGWSASEVMGGKDPLISDDERTTGPAVAARVLTGEVTSGKETSFLHKDGSPISICLACGPILDAEGRVTGIMKVLTDHRQAKRLAQHYLQGQKMEAFGQLAGGVAHDFNNLLTVIMGFSELVLERLTNQPELAADVEEIRKAGERASQLTRQLLAFSRKQLWVRDVLDLNQVITHFEKMLSRIVSESIRLEIVAAPSLGHTKADPGQIEQLLMNLVVNARDAMLQGGNLTITTANVVLDASFVRQHTGAVAGRYVSLTVQDTGTGMTPDVLARVFEPFYTTKGPGKGTGLGLSTVFGLVEQSDGFITIASTPGVGTIVTTYWPTVDDAVEFTAAAPGTIPMLEGTETILLVEDEAEVRHLIGKVLERYGYTVLQAQDADDALAVEERYGGPIHLLVSDMVMPGLSGPDLAQRLVQRRPSMQALFVSGYASSLAIDRGLSSHNASFLQKPFKGDVLAMKVRERLDKGLARSGNEAR